MLKVGICEDIPQELLQLKNMVADVLAELSVNADMQCFESGEDLLCEVEASGSIDVFFLDIQMQGLNGVETARMIREKDNRAVLIFVSAYDEYCKELIEVQPFAFIDKPVAKERVRQVLAHAVQTRVSAKESYQFSYQKVRYNIPFDEIRYFQSDRRVVRISTQSTQNMQSTQRENGQAKEYLFYGKLGDVEKEIAKSGTVFLRVRKSFLVNPRFIVRYQANQIVLDNGMTLEISRHYKDSVKQFYLKTLRDKV